jgi:hypothetical protein
MQRLRRLTDAGVVRFQQFLDTQGTSEAEAFDIDYLIDPKFTTIAGTGPEVSSDCGFVTRFEAAEILDPIIQSAELDEAAFDRGVWSWLAWFWFESLCPADKTGLRDPQGSERWVLDTNWKRYYRHLLAGPWWIYQTHREDPERARALLHTNVNKPGELVGQFAASQELVSNPGLVEMVTRLYYDPVSNKLRRGHGRKTNGGSRRLVKVIGQLDMIWDLYSTTADDFLKLLPKEFDSFKPK